MPSALAAPAKTGELSGWGIVGSVEADAAEADHAAVVVGVGRSVAAAGEAAPPTARPTTNAPGTSIVATAIVTSHGISEASPPAAGPTGRHPRCLRLCAPNDCARSPSHQCACAVTKSLRSPRSTPVCTSGRLLCRRRAGSGSRVRGPAEATAEWVHDHGRTDRSPSRHLRRPGGPHRRRPHLRDLRHHGAGAERALRHRPAALFHQGAAGEPAAPRGRAARLGRRHRGRGRLGRQPRGARPGRRRQPPTRSPSPPSGCSCRTSPACRRWSTWPPCATRWPVSVATPRR